MALPDVPPGFVDLNDAFKTGDRASNVIGICTDFLPAVKSGGTDFTIKFTLHDPRWIDGWGMPFRFFHRDINRLPKIENQGDVLVLRNVKTTSKRGERFAWSNSSTSWVVLEHSSVVDSVCPHGSDIKLHLSGLKPYQAPYPTSVELQYAKAIAQLEDSSSWPRLASATHLQVASIMQSTGGTAPQRAEKFRLIRDIVPPGDNGDYIFVELFGEVRRMYNNDFRVEISVTDYTENRFLYNYKHGDDEDGYDGDQFNYVQGTSKMWPGPWGRMTMLVNLWPPHDSFARSEVREGSFVYLRNVQVKHDRDGKKIEGHCRGDRMNPAKINVSVFKPREKDGDQRFKDLLRRKRDYEKNVQVKQLGLSQQLPNKRKISDESNDGAMDPKAKKNRDRKNKTRLKTKAVARDEPNNSSSAISKPLNQQLNVHVRTNNINIPLTTITDILEPAILARTTPQGNAFSVPFQNCRYKSKVRVIDYFPDNIADFAAPVREDLYEMLSEHESDDSDVEVAMPCSTPNGSSVGDVRWEWRFFLLVEDAHPPPRTRSDNLLLPPQMQLLVAGTDGDYLLNADACNLRDPRNATALASLTEKMFVLWGDLAERKEEMQHSTETNGGGDGDRKAVVKPSARPFECFIKEYGALQRKKGQENGADGEEYERMFRICYTSI